MVRRIVIRVCLVVSLALVVAAAACQSDKATPSPSATPGQSSATPAELPTTAAGTPRPSLTQEQQQTVADLATRDPNVQRILQSLSVGDIKVVAWSNGQGTLIGGGIAMNLTQPATLEGEWRSISWVDSSQTNYGVTIYTAKLSNITTINVWVDLTKGAVVGWSTNSTAKLETAPVIIATPAIQ